MIPNHQHKQTSPIRILPACKCAAAVIEEVLTQAEERGIIHAIAKLLIGCTLEVCVGGQYGREIAPQHKWNNAHDDMHSLGDYQIKNVSILVTMSGPPNERYRMKANSIAASGTDQCWLIVRSEKIRAWQRYLAKTPSNYPTLICCSGICEFIDISVTMMRCRSTQATDPLRDIIVNLNNVVARVGRRFLPAATVDLAC